MAQEKLFENKIKKFLALRGSWYIKYWGGAKFTKEGVPDLLACIDGKFYGIEIKAPTGKPTLIQLINLRDIRKAGGRGVLLYPNDWDAFVSFVDGGGDVRFKWYIDNINTQADWFKNLNK